MKDEKHTEEDLEYARDEFAEMMKVGARLKETLPRLVQLAEELENEAKVVQEDVTSVWGYLSAEVLPEIEFLLPDHGGEIDELREAFGDYQGSMSFEYDFGSPGSAAWGTAEEFKKLYEVLRRIQPLVLKQPAAEPTSVGWKDGCPF